MFRRQPERTESIGDDRTGGFLDLQLAPGPVRRTGDKLTFFRLRSRVDLIDKLQFHAVGIVMRVLDHGLFDRTTYRKLIPVLFYLFTVLEQLQFQRIGFVKRQLASLRLEHPDMVTLGLPQPQLPLADECVIGNVVVTHLVVERVREVRRRALADGHGHLQRNGFPGRIDGLVAAIRRRDRQQPFPRRVEPVGPADRLRVSRDPHPRLSPGTGVTVREKPVRRDAGGNFPGPVAVQPEIIAVLTQQGSVEQKTATRVCLARRALYHEGVPALAKKRRGQIEVPQSLGEVAVPALEVHGHLTVNEDLDVYPALNGTLGPTDAGSEGDILPEKRVVLLDAWLDVLDLDMVPGCVSNEPDTGVEEEAFPSAVGQFKGDGLPLLPFDSDGFQEFSVSGKVAPHIVASNRNAPGTLRQALFEAHSEAVQTATAYGHVQGVVPQLDLPLAQGNVAPTKEGILPRHFEAEGSVRVPEIHQAAGVFIDTAKGAVAEMPVVAETVSGIGRNDRPATGDVLPFQVTPVRSQPCLCHHCGQLVLPLG